MVARISFLLSIVFTGCATTQVSERESQVQCQPTRESRSSPRPWRPVYILLFPVNLVPDIISNTIVFLFNHKFSDARGEPRSNLWPVIIMLAPCMGPISGILDAASGYPFWDPVALEEHRKYPWMSE